MEEVRQRARHIFQKDNCWPALSDDAEGVGDEVAGVGVAPALPGDGEGLARRAASHAIHDASKPSGVESGEVAEDGSAVKESVTHSGAKDRLTERLALDVGDDARRRDGEREARLKTRHSGTQRENIHRRFLFLRKLETALS